MKKKLFFCGMILISLGLMGCPGKEPKKIEYSETKEVGTFVSTVTIATSFNEYIKSTVTTTDGTFTVYGHVSGFKGDPVVVKKRSKDSRESGKYDLFIGKGKHHRVSGL